MLQFVDPDTKEALKTRPDGLARRGATRVYPRTNGV
jgi:hypothetical protein